MITSAFKGEFNFSDWQVYVGSAVGGAIGSFSLVHLGIPAISNFLDGAFSSMTTDLLYSYTSTGNSKTTNECINDAILNGIINYHIGEFDNINFFNKNQLIIDADCLLDKEINDLQRKIGHKTFFNKIKK